MENNSVNGSVAQGSYEESRQWIGYATAPEACDVRVSAAQIREYAAVLQDDNENYWNESAARRRFGGIVSPPGMLLCWSLALPWKPDRADAALKAPLPLRVPLPGATLVNVSTDTAFYRPVLEGMELFVEEEVLDVSPKKMTALGTGHFVTTAMRFLDEEGVLLADNKNVMLRYEAGETASQPRDSSRNPKDAGRLLETIRIPVTLRLAIMAAHATRDFFPGHHDRDYARSQGVPDVYLNTMFLQGAIDRVAGCWAGGDTWIRRRKMSMSAPVCVGDTLELKAHVVEESDSGARLSVVAGTAQGVSATALVDVTAGSRKP